MNRFVTCFVGAIFAASAAIADGHWVSVEGQSSVAFGSVKKDVVGEVHHFSGVKGTVGADGAVKILIDLTSLETNIDIRNERMGKHVFNAQTSAALNGEVDMDDVSALSVGDTALTDFEGVLKLGAVEVDIEAEMLVARLADNRVLVTTADFIMLSTEDLGVNAGIDKLMELAKLPGITRITPVSVRMVLEK
jgi:hypothetical protein